VVAYAAVRLDGWDPSSHHPRRVKCALEFIIDRVTRLTEVLAVTAAMLTAGLAGKEVVVNQLLV
jgi:hypothetical protein